MSARTLKLIGAAGAAALTIGTVAGPAVAAGEETASVSYTCVTAAGNATPSATYAVNTPPATMVAGQTVKLPTTSTITLDATTTGLAVGAFQWASFNGTITTPPTASTVGQNLTIAKTPMGNGAGGTTVATATGTTNLRASKAGTYTLMLGNLGAGGDGSAGNVTLNGFFASGAAANTVQFPDGSTFGQCTANAKVALANAAGAPATVAVSKDKSKTTVKASEKNDKVTATAKVKGHFGLAGTGKVKFTLKKGSKTVKSVSGKLKNGAAKVTFKNVKAKGSYSVVASFKGDKALKGSTGKKAFKIK